MIIELDDYRPHSNYSMICICGKTWIATAISGIAQLECPQCGLFVEVDYTEDEEME